MQIDKPNKDNYPKFYDPFISSVKSNDLIKELETNYFYTIQFFKSIDKEKLLFKYQKNKWTIIQVFKHIIDCEEMYFKRSQHFSKLKDTNLPDFDVNKAMELVSEEDLEINKLVEEFKDVRRIQIEFFKSLTPNQLDFKGKASGAVLTSRSLGYISVGHSNHHISIIEERYLN